MSERPRPSAVVTKVTDKMRSFPIDWHLRSVEQQDVPSIARLHMRTALHAFAEIFPSEAPPPTLAAMSARWSAWIGPERPRHQQAWVLSQGTRLIGVVLAGPDPDDHRLGHLSRLYVDPVDWGVGAGRQLHDCAITHLRGCDFEKATLWVLEANVRARSWYERLGWLLTGRRKASYEPRQVYDVGYERRLR